MTTYIYHCPRGHATMQQFPTSDVPESICCEGWIEVGHCDATHDSYAFKCPERAIRFYTSPGSSYKEVK